MQLLLWRVAGHDRMGAMYTNTCHTLVILRIRPLREPVEK